MAVFLSLGCHNNLMFSWVIKSKKNFSTSYFPFDCFDFFWFCSKSFMQQLKSLRYIFIFTILKIMEMRFIAWVLSTNAISLLPTPSLKSHKMFIHIFWSLSCFTFGRHSILFWNLMIYVLFVLYRHSSDLCVPDHFFLS